MNKTEGSPSLEALMFDLSCTVRALEYLLANPCCTETVRVYKHSITSSFQIADDLLRKILKLIRDDIIMLRPSADFVPFKKEKDALLRLLSSGEIKCDS